MSAEHIPGPDSVLDARTQQIDNEQRVLDEMYSRYDHLVETTESALRDTRAGGATGTPQARSERDSFASLYESRLTQLEAAEDKLCFGRIDLETEQSLYVGRIGLSDEDQRQLLVDWRAPAARPFYQATSVDPAGATLRRHLTTEKRQVVAIEDDVLDLDAVDPATTLSGEGSLLRAVRAARTGRMGDIVATIQAEQDRIIRSDLPGVLVVQGGPGTGKTAVALHRAAYLLYTYREQLERSGVLLVGPSPIFLRYISQVLPSLGETGVVTTTIASLLPDVRAERRDPPHLAALKGSLAWVEILRTAITRWQRLPARTLRFEVRGIPLSLTRGFVERTRSRVSGRPHNLARERFLRHLLDELARQLASGLRLELDADTRADLVSDLRQEVDIRRELNLLWLPLTATRVLSSLYSDPAHLAWSAPGLDDGTRAALQRPDADDWSDADIPLLDELAELLGEDDAAEQAQRAVASARQRADLDQAQRVLELGMTTPGMVSAAQLAQRWEQTGPRLSVAERAAGDRAWTYGHIIVDEAQELSPMAWRALARRTPRRSMTVVGDLAQSSAVHPADSWADLLADAIGSKFRLEELSVTYRTPQQIMDLAAAVLAASGSSLTAPSSVRVGEESPTAVRIDPPSVPGLADVVRRQYEGIGQGRLAVLMPRRGDAWPTPRQLAAAIASQIPTARVGHGPAAIDDEIAVLSIGDAKGLEFDGVVIVEPAAYLDDGRSGWGDLYVALTRATRSCTLVHHRPLPESLANVASEPEEEHR